MLKPALNNKGFTLIEIIVSVALLAVLTTLGWNLFNNIYNSNKKAEEQWKAQKECQAAAQYITNSLRGAKFVEIRTNHDYSGNISTAQIDYYIFMDSGRLMLQQNNAAPIAIENISRLTQLEFARIQDSIGNVVENCIQYQVACGSNNTVISAVKMDNMILERGNNQSMVGLLPGNTIHFRTDEDLQASAVSTVDCFIATAAYGSPFSPAVGILQEFRDRFMLGNKWGRYFVNYYYKFSPPAAQFIKNNPRIKIVVRIFLLPLVIIAYTLLHYEYFLLLVIAVLWFIAIKFLSLFKIESI